MKNAVRKKAITLTLIVVLCFLLMAASLITIYIRKVSNAEHATTMAKLEEIQEQVDSAMASAQDTWRSYDELYISTANTLAYMARNTEDFIYVASYMRELCAAMNVSNIIVADREGNVVTSAVQPYADVKSSRFNQIRDVFADERTESISPFSVSFREGTRRYYASKISDDLEIIIEHDPSAITEQIETISSYQRIMDSVIMGGDGFAFAVSSRDYSFLSYSRNPGLVGHDALSNGLSMDVLQDGNAGFYSIGGETFYCGVKEDQANRIFIVTATPLNEIVTTAVVASCVILLVFLMAATVVAYFGYRLYKDTLLGVNGDDDRNRKFVIKRRDHLKLVSAAVAGVVLVVGMSLYIQVICDTSDLAVNSSRTVDEISRELRENEANAAELETTYNARYLNKAQIASYILSANPQLKTRSDLIALNRALDTNNIFIFNSNGDLEVSSSSYVNLSLSTDPADQTYEFRRLLNGVESLVQEPRINDLGLFFQYIGVTLKDEEGLADGFVQIELVPTEIEDAVNAANIDSVLTRAASRIDGIIFTVDKTSGNFNFHSQSEYIGRIAADSGIDVSVLRDGFRDYMTINGVRYLADCIELEGDYAVVAMRDANSSTGDLLSVALCALIVSGLSLILVCVVINFSRWPADLEGMEVKEDGFNRFTVTMPNGTTKRTTSVASRFSIYAKSDGGFKTASESASTLMKVYFTIIVTALCIMMLFRDSFFAPDSIIMYILGQEWERGVNIFSITASLLYISIGAMVVIIIRLILRRLAASIGARGATVCQLMRSVAKYLVVLVLLFYCLSLFGVNTGTLLASAGLLSVAIGLGAQSLIADILAGLFIIFEGEFQVGDIITLDGWRGTVMEIGVRTTKVESAGGDVKIFSNSKISGVINMTRKNSYAGIDVGIEYGESLERVEAVLAEELPKLKESIPDILEGPFYKGVSALADSSVNLKILALCPEGSRVGVERALYRGVKLIFDRNDINIPFPQIVLNQPPTFKEATKKEKEIAEKFHAEQQEASKQYDELEEEEKN